MSAALDREPGDVLARAIASLPEAPAHPPAHGVLSRVEEVRRAPRWTAPLVWTTPMRLFVGTAAAMAVLLGVFVTQANRGAGRVPDAPPTASPEAEVARARFEERAEARVLSGAAEFPAAENEGATVAAGKEPVVLALADGAEVRLDPGARAEFRRMRSPDPRVRLVGGRARFDLSQRGPKSLPLVVEVVSSHLYRILDVGTKYSVDVSRPNGAAGGTDDVVLVTVDEGAVVANGTRVEAGNGVLLRQGRASVPWPLDARPTVELEADDPAPKAGAPVDLRVVLRNPTGGWIPLPEPDPVRAPLWIEVTHPDGKSVPVRVTASMLVPGSAPRTAIPPGGHVALRVRFDRTFASPGTYRLRAVYRPAGAVDRPASQERVLRVH